MLKALKKSKDKSPKESKKNFEVKKANDILLDRERLATLGQFVGGIIHNMGTPLMGAMGQLMINDRKIEMLKEELEKNRPVNPTHISLLEEMQKHSSYVKEYIHYMGDLVETIKTQIRSSADGVKEQFTIKSIYDKVGLLLAFELKKSRIKINYEVSKELETHYIHGEIACLVQIMVNLIKNAIDSYNDEPGKINVKSYIHSENDTEKFIKIEVQDFGSGISEQVKTKIFKQMITTKGTKGTGIGVYMSNVMVKAKFGGYIDFESEVGKGTTMYIELPMNL